MNEDELLPIGALVETDLGEGFIVGRNYVGVNKGFKPNYDVRLMDGSIWHLLDTKSPTTDQRVLQWVTLIDRTPIDHPNMPRGLRALLMKSRETDVGKETHESK